MKGTLTPIALASLVFCSSIQANATDDEEWEPISNPGELRDLLAEKILTGSQFIDYYRGDGVMAYFNTEYGTVVVRKWKVRDDGAHCTYMYKKPHKLVECAIYSRSARNPNVLRLEMEDKGYSMVGTLSSDPPPDNVNDVISDVAGPPK